MTTKASTKSASPPARKNTATKKAANPCWPGYEPTPGKKPFTEGSCKPVAGKKKGSKA